VAALEADVADVVGRVVVADLTVGPLAAFDAKLFTGLHPLHHRDVGVPPVVAGDLLVEH
jgi:hypothetical protein